MCAEGIRIGRRTDSKASGQVTATVAGVQLFSRNPNRIALIVTCAERLVDPATDAIVIYAGDVVKAKAIGQVNQFSPTLMLDVERFGQVVTDEIYAAGLAVDADVYATEIFLDVTLEEASEK